MSGSRSVSRRRQVLEKHLRVHYPTLRTGDSLFPEYDSHDFSAIGHRGYGRVLREFAALQNRLHGGTKFECLVRYRCANLFFLVLPNELIFANRKCRSAGARWSKQTARFLWCENQSGTTTPRKPASDFFNASPSPGTRQFNRALGITREEIVAAGEISLKSRCRSRTNKLRPVISVGCGRPSRKSSVGATSARMPSSTRNCRGIFARHR